MSMNYWMNEGVGVRESQIRKYLDKHKVFEIISNQLPGEDITEEDFDIEDFLYGNPYENIGDFLCSVDDSNCMTYGDNGCDESYFLYQPSYPWNRSKDEPQTLEEVHKIIVNALMKVTNLTAEQANALIDNDIYEYGCG